MLKIKSAARLAITMGVICASAIWLSLGLKIVPDPFQSQVDGRVGVSKAIGISIQSFAEKNRIEDMERVIGFIATSNKDVKSIGVQARDGSYIVETPTHQKTWRPLRAGRSTGNQIQAEVLRNGRRWANMQVQFEEVPLAGFSRLLQFPLPLVAFLSSVMVLLSWFVLGRTFRYMNPSNVVPGRVRSALDTLTEGLALVDASGQVAHANKAFCHIVNSNLDEVMGQEINDFGWIKDVEMKTAEYPWFQCIQDKGPVCGQILELPDSINQKFLVNATPIYSDNGEKLKGVLVSFDNVTAIEGKKTELSRMVLSLRRSRDEVERTNEKLNFLASYDPMTKCMNRRAFWVTYEELWGTVDPSQLSILMVDIDKFKTINDTYGHSVGDDVIVGVGELLRDIIGSRGIICRYGGEEFTALLPNLSADEAVDIAKEVHAEFHNRRLADLEVTASIGVSNRGFGAMDAQHMIDQADECLYDAKRNGRDQVVRFDQRPEISEEKQETPAVEVEASAAGTTGEGVTKAARKSSTIEYSTVTALLSALSFRSQDTAEHSIRVADLALAISEGLIEKSDSYLLETSALLHDIGKIGVPDAILNKPGPLTVDEWEVMRKHDDIGVAIIQSALASEDIAEIIRGHHYYFAAPNSEPVQAYFQDEIPMATRIITVCDSFDAMVTDRKYRETISIEAACEELQRLANIQFDPNIVSRLIAHVKENGYQIVKGQEFVITPSKAASIGKNIESLFEAVAEKNVTGLQEIVQRMKNATIEQEDCKIGKAVERLDSAMGEPDLQVERVLELAEDVIDLCRSTRQTFISTAEEIAKDGLTIG